MTSSATPVLLLSTERSGSNLTRSILNTHSRIAAPHPLETAYPWRKTKSADELSKKQRRALVRDVLINKQYSFQPLVESVEIDAVANRLEEFDKKSFLAVQQALYDEYADTVDATHWASKDPGMWDYLDRAFERYDDLNVIYLVRDPRDVVLSFKTSNVGQYHPYFNAMRWQSEQERGLELLENHPESVHRIRYEDLLQNPESEAEDICSFLDIEYEPEMLYYYESEDAQRASDSAEVFENLSVPIKSDNYGKYKDRLPDEEVLITEAVVAEELEAHGYDLEHDRPELDELNLEPDSYKKADAKLARSASIDDWRKNFREQVARFASRSFSHYMVLRYGLLA